MINLDKPDVGVPQTELNIGDGFNLLVGSGFQLIIGALNALAGMTNIVRPSQGETWNTVASTWATEDETWLGISQLIDNITKPSSTMTNLSKP